jgi:hypothetical protein
LKFVLILAVQVLVNVISGGLTPSFTSKEAEEMGAKIISESLPCDGKVDAVY